MDALHSVLSTLRLNKLAAGVSSCPPAWNLGTNESRFLRFSCWSISGFGVLLLLLRGRLAYLGYATWPWTIHGAWWILQGVASVEADVHHCGKPSVWHSIDKQLAIGTSCSSAALCFALIFGAFGLPGLPFIALFPALCMFVLTIALYGLSTRAQKDKDLHGFLFWHGSFHYALVLGHLVLVLSCLRA